jgi:hypothetical protein
MLALALAMSIAARLGMKRSLQDGPSVSRLRLDAEPTRVVVDDKLLPRWLSAWLVFSFFLRSQRVGSDDLKAEVVRPERASYSARSAAEVGLFKEDIGRALIEFVEFCCLFLFVFVFVCFCFELEVVLS